jgi:hypothetical protein
MFEHVFAEPTPQLLAERELLRAEYDGGHDGEGAAR